MLVKNICRKCWMDFRKRMGITVPTLFDEYWQNNVSLCSVTYASLRKLHPDGNPPENCLYILEQTLEAKEQC